MGARVREEAQQTETLSLHMTEALRKRLEGIRNFVSERHGRSVTMSEVARQLLESAREDRLEMAVILAERPSSVVPSMSLVVFAILVVFWAAELAYISRALLSGGSQAAWSWLIHITPRASIFSDPPAHEIWIQQLILGLLILVSGYISRRLWFPLPNVRRNAAKKACVALVGANIDFPQ